MKVFTKNDAVKSTVFLTYPYHINIFLDSNVLIQLFPVQLLLQPVR